MTKEQIVGLGVRLFAIFLALYTLRQAPGLMAFAKMSPPDYATLWVVAVLTIIFLLVAILLWCLPLTVARKLIPKVERKKKAGALSISEIQVMAYSVVGLWVLTTAISDAVHWTVFVYRVKSMDAGYVQLSPQNIGDIVATVVELVIGFWLLFGAKGLIGIIRRARQAGTQN